MTTTRAGFLRGLFALGANLVGNGVDVAAAAAESALAPNGSPPADAAHAPPFLTPMPLCGPGGDFTPELLRLEAERLGLPADANGNDVLRRLHQAMLDMAPPRTPEADETAARGASAPTLSAQPASTSIPTAPERQTARQTGDLCQTGARQTAEPQTASTQNR